MSHPLDVDPGGRRGPIGGPLTNQREFKLSTPTAAPAVIPAAPGWVARRPWFNPDTDAVESQYFAVIGWSVDEDGHGEPLIHGAEGGDIDAVFFEPSLMPVEPSIDKAAIREQAAA